MMFEIVIYFYILLYTCMYLDVWDSWCKNRPTTKLQLVVFALTSTFSSPADLNLHRPPPPL